MTCWAIVDGTSDTSCYEELEVVRAFAITSS